MVWSNPTRVPHPRLAPAASAAPAQPIVPTATEVATGSTPSVPPAPAVSRTINVNSATAAELELLPGIGPALAKRIIDDRAAHGPFKSVGELDRVQGIGPQTIEHLRP